MQAQKPQAEQLLLVDQVADVGAREARARRARAALLERPRIAGEAGVAQVQPARRGERGAGAGRAGRQDAVEHVDAGPDHAQDPLGVADPHEVARLLRGQERRRPAGRARTSRPGSPRPRARRARGRRSRARRSPRSSGGAAPGRRRPARSRRRSWPGARSASRCRSAQSVVRRTASSSSARGTPAGGQMSRHIAMSEPRFALDRADELGREARRRAVVDRAERDAVVVDLEQRVPEREDLEAARVGQDRPVPAGEARAARRAPRSASSPGRKCRW